MTTTEKITIAMSERRPLSIVKADWPLIASADRHDGQVKCQANHVWAIRVREHKDGRRIVYGWLREGEGGAFHGWRGAEGGFLLTSDANEDETIRAIRRIGGIIDDDALAQSCIADLPAESIDKEDGAEPDMNGVETVNSSVSGLLLLSLLTRAAPHAPEPLGGEIRAMLATLNAEIHAAIMGLEEASPTVKQ